MSDGNIGTALMTVMVIFKMSALIIIIAIVLPWWAWIAMGAWIGGWMGLQWLDHLARKGKWPWLWSWMP